MHGEDVRRQPDIFNIIEDECKGYLKDIKSELQLYIHMLCTKKALITPFIIIIIIIVYYSKI